MINGYPWSESALGKIEDWPASLCTAVSIMLEARIPMYIAWGDNFIQFFNDAYIPILGEKKIEDAIGRSTYETWSEIWPVIGPMFESVLHKGENHGFPAFNFFLERRGFKEETFFDFSYSSIRNADGSVGGVFITCLETTERVLHERRMEMLANTIPVNYDRELSADFLKESHSQLSATPRDLPYSLFIEYDTQLDSFRCLSSFGMSNPETANKSFLSPEGVEIIRNQLIEGLIDNKILFKEGVQYDLKPWEETPSQTYIVPCQYNHYKTRNIVLLGLSSRSAFNELYKQFFRLCARYLQHQYEHFQMRKQEEEQLRAIKELSVKKDEFISVASHELKTPLTSAKAFLQIANRNILEDGNRKFITGALKQLDRLQALTADLLDVSKINAGRLEYKMSQFDFAVLLDDAVSNFQSTITTHTIEIAEKVSSVMEGDYHRLEQVINNLLSNAVKYSPQADRIIVRSTFINQQLVVSVRDFGVGIATDKIHRLFERFYRIEETAMHFQGMGLGLFIVSEILGRHKGRFWIESRPEEGSTFYFMLPVKDSHPKVSEIIDEDDYYSDSHISITVDNANRWLYVDWKGFQDNQTVRQGGLKMLSVLQRTGFSKVLNDNRNVLGTWSDAAEWVGEDWFPMMEASGLKCFAWIYSHSTFSQLSADKSIDVLKGAVISRFFNEESKARQWLTLCDP